MSWRASVSMTREPPEDSGQTAASLMSRRPLPLRAGLHQDFCIFFYKKNADRRLMESSESCSEKDSLVARLRPGICMINLTPRRRELHTNEHISTFACCAADSLLRGRPYLVPPAGVPVFLLKADINVFFLFSLTYQCMATTAPTAHCH